MGSTNYGKLTNVSVVPEASAGAIVGADGTGAAGSGNNYAQTFEFLVTAVNNNIIRFPVVLWVSLYSKFFLFTIKTVSKEIIYIINNYINQ